jgi:2-polyprenyl-3-methyl-5-hydroxy-6-metoxy-1,4-benzoquinol methylase
MDKNYWEKIFKKDYDVEIFDVLKYDRKEVIKSYINTVVSPHKDVADIGCGIGKWLPFLSDAFKRVYAVDLSTSNLNYAENRYKKLDNISYFNADLSKPYKFEKRFDVILCIAAIITSSQSKRDALFRSLSINVNNGGHVILVVPSFESFLYKEFVYNKCKRQQISFPKQSNNTVSKKEFNYFKHGSINLDQVPTKHYLKEELIIILQELGFRIEKIDKVEFSWKIETDKAPSWAAGMGPWDWIVVAQKIKP